MTSETDTYRRDGYVALPGLFPVEVLDAFYRQMNADLTRGGGSLQAFASTGPLLRKNAIEVYGYQYPPMLNFLWGLTPRMAEVAGCELLPTYCYFRLYQKDDICRVHSDRYACEHSLSLTLGYADGVPWALSVAHQACEPGGRVNEDFEAHDFGSIAMRPGDAVAYQGVHRRHGRLEPNPNRWSTHLFLHWVDRAGSYAEEAFDRPSMQRAGLL